MNKSVYTIRDLKAEMCPAIFLEDRDATAIRAVREAVLNGKSNLSLYPEDFQLVRIGTYDVDTGVIVPVDHVILCNLDTLIARKD